MGEVHAIGAMHDGAADKKSIVCVVGKVDM